MRVACFDGQPLGFRKSFIHSSGRIGMATHLPKCNNPAVASHANPKWLAMERCAKLNPNQLPANSQPEQS
jgi:hypothetical protein